MAVWYPASGEAQRHRYSPLLAGNVIERGEASDCTGLPLIIFSHGFAGCGTQSVFLTEELARAGYIVAAPDHSDAACSVDHSMKLRLPLPQKTFLTGLGWSEKTYRNRRRDIENVLEYMLEFSSFAGMIDQGRIGALGHSLGGYTVLGMAGAWPGWHDPRIKAVAAVSPFVKPYLRQDRLKGVKVPVMLQGAQYDWGVTPTLHGETGAFARLLQPKYYLELNGGSHLEWTNAVCLGHRSVQGCLDKRDNASLIVKYTLAFFDKHLKGNTDAFTRMHGEGARTWEAARP